MSRRIVLLFLWAGLLSGTSPVEGAEWRDFTVPGTWEEKNSGRNPCAWIRCWVTVPSGWSTQAVTLSIENVATVHEAFVNDARVGGAGRFPPDLQSGLDQPGRYAVPPERLRPDQWNLIAVRIYDSGNRGGFQSAAPVIGTAREHIALAGTWEIRIGDEPAKLPAEPAAEPSRALFREVEPGGAPTPSGGHAMAGRSDPLPPTEAARTFTVPDDLDLELVLAEPEVRQPVFMMFDERGRLWVVQYLQYPAPAGLKVVSRDEHWRAVYDKVPAPPPHGVRGLDKITIHEDTDGDGRFDRHKTFVDGLNIATSCARGRGGVWVLNPPYLLFYPDANDDDVPDGPPVVHLEGFGLEDTHSVVNSLRWGPDGWLYAAQGSTVTAQVRVVAPGARGTNVFFSQGQNIWRYHPGRHIYEVFAEGGGNAFGVELDNAGRLFSGHNGGDTRGFHYDQGAYLRKGFEKHGELSNPYAFGYFPQMAGTKGERFSHTFLIYHGGALPPRYAGKLFGVEPLQGRVVLSELRPDRTTFATRDLERVVTSSDDWFRPVDIKAGPDGAIYLADWYDRQVTHTRNQEGNIDTSNGRIYRLKSKGAHSRAPFALGRQSSGDLAALLRHDNQWFRQTAQRLLADRRDPSVIPHLTSMLETPGNPAALEALWAIHVSHGPAGEFAVQALEHGNPLVRLWAARLLGDERHVAPAVAARLAALAGAPTLPVVRVQLAATAQRLPAAQALPILRQLLRHDPDAGDPRLPLLTWWALESKCESDRDAVLNFFVDSTLWERPLVRQHLLDKVMRRFAAAGTRADLLACARLLELAPSRELRGKLMEGFEAAFQGRALTGLPDELVAAMRRYEVGSEALRLRSGDEAAVARALAIVSNPSADPKQRRQFIEILGETKQAGAVPSLLALLTNSAATALQRAALGALLSFDAPEIGRAVVARYPALTGEVRTAAQTLLASRATWSGQLVDAVETGRLDAAAVPPDLVRKLMLHRDSALATKISILWPHSGRPTTGEMQTQIGRLTQVIKSGPGRPYPGRELFRTACASCHRLYQEGGQVGPDLTAYQRGDWENLLLHLVNPSAEIREGYESFTAETKDGRTLSGFLVERDAARVVLRGGDGQNVTLDRTEIVEWRGTGLSLMPEGLLDGLTDAQVRDLFAYLRGTQPLTGK